VKIDLEGDYFQMTFLAVKMLHVQEYDSDEYIKKADANKMYERAKQLKLPFYKWYEWIENQFESLRTGIDDPKFNDSINFESDGPQREGANS
jgi:hypothetical protein